MEKYVDLEWCWRILDENLKLVAGLQLSLAMRMT